MLDLAFGLTRTSRLGCQIIITEELDVLIPRVVVSDPWCYCQLPGSDA